jgi:hypothetical protein
VNGDIVAGEAAGRGAAATTDGNVTLDDHWHDLVTVALLGTDRRDPPPPPDGPLADLVADTVRPAPSSRMLADVAATAVARRAGVVPGPCTPPLQGPPHDRRPLTSTATAATWRYVVREWPVLEDEWFLTAIHAGRRPQPDVLVAALARHRTDPVRRARVAVAAGPVASWVTEHVPALAERTDARVDVEAVTSLPELAVPPDLAALLAADAVTVAAVLRPLFDAGRFGAAHRGVLVNFLARCRSDVLLDVAAALDATDAMSPSAGLALSLADLARTRARMLAELVAEH